MDASARGAGNRIDLATRAGKAIFSTTWPAQVSQVSVNQLDRHVIVGIRVWGVKFHAPMTRAAFVGEAASLVQKAFTALPQAEEVDLWASVPIKVGKGVIVSGDLAKPTSRTVFSLTTRRPEAASHLAARASSSSAGVFWDQDWAARAFKS